MLVQTCYFDLLCWSRYETARFVFGPVFYTTKQGASGAPGASCVCTVDVFWSVKLVTSTLVPDVAVPNVQVHHTVAASAIDCQGGHPTFAVSLGFAFA